MTDEERAREWIDERGYTETSPDGDDDVASLADLLAAVRAEEREACAKVAEDGFGAEPVSVSSYIADKIRKRGTP